MITKEFVLSELSKNQSVKPQGNSVFILCPFHEDNIPSCSVSLGGKATPGVFNCFSCKASGSWNVIAQKLGLATVGEEKNLDTHYYVNNTKIELFKPINVSDLTLSEIDCKCKNYSIKFLKKFGAKKLWHDKLADYFLYFPFTYLEEDYGFIRAKLFKESFGPKYWFNIETKLLYPVDYLLQFNTPIIVLVEGIADAFRLLYNGIPALACLGTTITDFHYELLETLCVEKIILCFDGDIAGKNATFGYSKDGRLFEGQVSLLSKAGFDVSVLVPPKDKDPDNMNFKYIKVLKNMILHMKGKLL